MYNGIKRCRMRWNEQQRLFDEMVGSLRELLINKGKEYSAGDDALSHFKSGGEIGVTPMQKLYIFLEKHLSSIRSYIKNGQTYSSESIDGRIHDAVNYLFLLLCLVKEEREQSVDAEKGEDEQEGCDSIKLC
jgi:hypothetical protein